MSLMDIEALLRAESERIAQADEAARCISGQPRSGRLPARTLVP